MQAPPRLRAIALTGKRGTVRLVLNIVLSVGALVAAIGYLLPAHRLYGTTSFGSWFGGCTAAQASYEGSFHTLYADGGPLSLVVLVGVALLTVLLARGRRRFGTGMLAGVLAAGAAIVAFSPVFLVHLLSSVEYGPGEYVFSAGVLGLFFVGVALVVAEPVLFVLERRRLVRAAQPAALPIARVITA